MGIDYYAGYADVIEWDAIVKLVPQAAAEFMAVIDKHRGDNDRDYLLFGIAQYFQFGYPDDVSELLSVLIYEVEQQETDAIEEIKAAYSKLQEAFGTATLQPGTQSKLKLVIGYHDSESQG